MVLTYVDSGVLIAAARGIGPMSAVASALLGDADRHFVSSDFVRLEVLPKATYYKRAVEVDFYQIFFDAVHVWVPTTAALIQLALRRAAEFDLSGRDALHVAAAESGGADELATTEKREKPICRATSIAVVSIHP